jgi:DNA-directed RNA polymerase alpha subunit
MESKTTFAGTIVADQRFAGRRLSRRVVDALLAAGVDAPERLLFMSEGEICKVPGIGKSAITEIKRYRRRFLPDMEV